MVPISFVLELTEKIICDQTKDEKHGIHDANPSSGFEATSKPIVKIKTPPATSDSERSMPLVYDVMLNLVGTPAAPAIHDPEDKKNIHTLPPSSIEPAARTITPP